MPRNMPNNKSVKLSIVHLHDKAKIEFNHVKSPKSPSPDSNKVVFIFAGEKPHEPEAA